MQKQLNKIISVVPCPFDLAFTFSGTLIKKCLGQNSVKAIICSTGNLEKAKQETYQASKIIGLNEVYFLRYQTGALKSSGLDNVKEDIFEIFKEERPSQVLTVGMHGYSRNPNSKQTALVTTLAYEKYCVGLGETQKCNLFYYVLPEESFKFFSSKGFFKKDKQGFDFESVPDKKITHVVDYTRFIPLKIKALKKFMEYQIVSSRIIELLRKYKSAGKDYFVLAEANGEKFNSINLKKISNRL